MSLNREQEVADHTEASPPKKKEVMPSYSYYFSDCSSIISSVKCAVSVDEDKSRSVSPSFGPLSSSANEHSSLKDYLNDNANFSMGDTVALDPSSLKIEEMDMEDQNSSNPSFDQEDELATASSQQYESMTIGSNEEMLERLPNFNQTGMGESYFKFDRWCKNYSSGNIEAFRNMQRDKMKEILEKNNFNIGDIKSQYFDEFPIKVLYSKGKTLTDNKFDVSTLKTGDLVVDKYLVESVIGTTTFSKVIKAKDVKKNIQVCIKIVLPEYFDQALDEIVLLKMLNSKDKEENNCIVKMYDSFLYSGSVFLVLELLGDNLFEASKEYYIRNQKEILNPTRPKKWNLNELKNISYDILKALNFIHSFGIINCDLKPENILLVKSQEQNNNNCNNNGNNSNNDNNNTLIKLIDFGSSCFIQDKLNTYVQSRSYRAPEVVLGLPYDTQIDMWSFGCILCELYMGRILFPSDNSATLVASMVSLLGAPPVYMLQHKMNSMFIILPNGNIADLNVPNHVMNHSPSYNRLDKSSLCCNLSASDSSKCSHVTYNKWENSTMNLEPTVDDNSSGMEDSSDGNLNLSDREVTKVNCSSFLDKHFKISNYEDSLRYQTNYPNNADCKIKLDIRHNRKGASKFMRIIQPYPSSIDSMLESEKEPELRVFSDFVKGLLQYDPLDRLTAETALQHPFIQSRKNNL